MTAAYDFPDAVAAARRGAEAQKAGEQAMREAAAELASKEQTYRVEFAKEIVRQHDVEKAAWTVAQDLARGNEHVARLRYERDVAKGVLEAAEQRAWRHTADRKDILEFIVWSKMLHGRDGAGEQPAWTPRAA